MSQIIDLLQLVESIRHKITPDEYSKILRNIGEIHKDYFPGIRTAETYPVTPKEVIQLIRGFLEGESRIQTEVACYLLNFDESYHYTTYGFRSFKEWMEHMGFLVSLNRVFEI